MTTEKYLLHQNRVFKAIDDFFHDDCKLAYRIDTEIPERNYIVRLAGCKEDLDARKNRGNSISSSRPERPRSLFRAIKNLKTSVGIAATELSGTQESRSFRV